MLLGQLYSEYQMTLASQHDMYRFDSGIFKSFSQIAYEALNKANEKMDIYFSAPTDVPLPVAVGSLAYDLATRTVWRYEGADADPPWSDVTYTILGQAIEVALQAKSLAESKITAYASATTPTGGKEGDLWYKLTENGRPYVYSGGQWSKLLGNEFTTLENSMSSIVQTLTGGMKIYRQATAPTSGMSVGDLWYNTIDGNACSKYSGTDWVPFGFTNMIAYIDSATDLSNSAKKDQIISTVRGSALYQSDLAGTVKTDAFYSALSAAIAESRQSIITQIDETIGSAVTAEASRAQQVESLIQSILTKYADYLTITTNGLSIGKSGSLFSIFLSDDQITLRQGESDVFRVIDGQIIMTKMKVVDKIAVGNPEDGYTVMDTTNSGLSIVWQATDPFAT
jgi:hypothetical protein